MNSPFLTTPDVAPPADATDVRNWHLASDGQPYRWFVGTERGDGPHVNIWGKQYADGSVERFVESDAGYLRCKLDADGAREHARHLLDAADEIDVLMR